MAETPIGGITHIDEAQDDKEVTANEAWDFLEALLQDFHTEDCTGSSNITIATDDARLHQFFDLTGAIGANIDVIVPQDASPPSYAKTYIVRNSTTGAFTVTFKPSGGAGVIIPRTGWQLVRSDGTDALAVADLGYVIDQKHGDGQGTAFGNSELVFHHVFTRDVDTPVDFEGSNAVLNTATTAQTDFTIHKNGAASIGTLRFAAAGTVGAWVATIAAQSFTRGDILTIVAPAGADATAADISITMRGAVA